MRILIADKDPERLELYRRILEKDKYSILIARNKTEVLRENNVEAIVIDLGMPSAFETIMSLRESRGTPIVAVSARSEQEATAKEFGADYFVTRAFRHINDLSDAIRYATQSKLEKV